MKRSMKLALALALLAVVAVAGIGYWQYTILRDNRVIDSVKPAVKNTSLRVTNALALLHSPSVSYQEAFRQLDDNVTEIGNRLLDVQTAATPSTVVWMRVIGDYLAAAQELLRAESQMFRQRLHWATALETAHDTIKRLGQADNEFERKLLNRQSSDAIADASRQATLLYGAGHDFEVALDKFIAARERLTSFVAPDALVDPAALTKARTEERQATR